ncbi:MAG TPA: hemerythrin domain-containing protein [Acidimicrobiales bacterium]|nr:hemerythrin domain-containing protein [Acidimicrobiales bacterium]
MCSYCGCESEAVIAELMAEHEQIRDLAHRAKAALTSGDVTTTASFCADIGRLFAAHDSKEEAGLFAELTADGEAAGAVSDLVGEHRALEAALENLAGGDVAGLDGVLTRLLDHAAREENDLFPAALQLLADGAWARIGKVHAEAA